MSPDWFAGLLAGLMLAVPIGLLLSHAGVPFLVDVAVSARDRRA